MTNILDLPTAANDSSITDDFFSRIVYKDDLLEMIDAILEEHTARRELIAKEHGDIDDNDLNETMVILGFVDRMHTEIKKYTV